MKKFTYTLMILFAFIAIAGSARATIHDVEVEDFEFNPTTMIVNVGDTIHWYWEEGFHTTTSLLIPAGAASWDQPLFSSSQTFDYKVTVAGSYDYICAPHASMGMVGHFTAIGSTGIAENTIPSLTLVKNYVNNGQLHIEFTSPDISSLSFDLYNIVGNQVISETFAHAGSGVVSREVNVGNLPKGVYIFSLIANNEKVTKRIILD